jgi:hypothetical protein
LGQTGQTSCRLAGAAGFHPAFIAISAGVNLVYQYWIHRALAGCPAVRAVMTRRAIIACTTPPTALSRRQLRGRVHHLGQMFGSFVPELDHDKPVYGAVKPILRSINPRGLWRDRRCCGLLE